MASSITKDGDAWTFDCGICEFRSVNHDTKKSAKQRRAEHMAEHEEIKEED